MEFTDKDLRIAHDLVAGSYQSDRRTDNKINEW